MNKKILLWTLVFLSLVTAGFAGTAELINDNTVWFVPFNFTNSTWGYRGGVDVDPKQGAGYDNFGLSNIPIVGANNSYNFGSTTYVQAQQNDNTLGLNGTHIFCMWFKNLQSGESLMGSQTATPRLVRAYASSATAVRYYYWDGTNTCNPTYTNASLIGSSTWHQFCGVKLSTGGVRLWIDGKNRAQDADTCGDGTSNQELYIGANNNGGPADDLTGYGAYVWIVTGVDANETVMQYLYNSTYPLLFNVTPPVTGEFIEFISQDPADLTTTNLFGQYLNITYNYTNTTGLSSAVLNYTVNSTLARCGLIVNGTCNWTIGDYFSLPNTTRSGKLHSFILDDNEIAPATYNLFPEDVENWNHNRTLLNNQVHAVKIELLNVSALTEQNEFEIMVSKEVVTSSLGEAYYCNSSYSSGLYTSSDNCVLFATYDEDDYDHCHRSDGGFNYSCHIVKSLPINVTTGEVLGVKVSPTSQFLFRPTSNNAWYFYHTNFSVSRPDAGQLTTNQGIAWSNLAVDVDAHLHQFKITDTLYYQACGTFGTDYNCSTVRSDTFDFDPLDPTAVTVISPALGDNVSGVWVINYTASVVSNGTPTYQINLLNSDLTFNRTIRFNNSNNLTYSWKTYLEDLALGQYYISVVSQDLINGLNSTSISNVWNLTANAVINITANDTLAGTSVTDFFGWAYDYNTSINRSFTTSSGSVIVPSIRGNSYLIRTQAINYTSDVANITATQNNITYYTARLYAFNSVRIRIFAFTNLTLIQHNVTVKIVGSVFGDERVTNNGTMNVNFLTPDDYELRFTSDGHNPISKFVTVTNDSTQSIDVYMTENATAELQQILVLDTSNQEVGGAIVWLQQEKIVNGTTQWITVQEAETNSEGKTSVFVVRDVTVFYRFAVVFNGVARPILPNRDTFSSKTNFIPGVTETVQIIVELEAGGTDVIDDRLAVVGNVTLVGQTAVFKFVDGRNSISGGTLKVWAKYLNSSLEYVLISEQSVSGSFGEINYTIPTINSTTWVATGYIDYPGREEVVNSVTITFPGREVINRGLAMLMTVFLYMSVALLTATFGPLVSSLAALGAIYLCWHFVLVSIPVNLLNSFVAIVIIVFFSFFKKQNG